MKLKNKKTGAVANYRIILQRETGNGSNEAPIKYVCGTLTKLNENWEDVDGTNDTNIPLIKDEKIRKAVRAWAECCGFSLLKHYLSEGLSCFICTDKEYNNYCRLDFTSRIDNLEYGKLYTVTELCGSEEYERDYEERSSMQ